MDRRSELISNLIFSEQEEFSINTSEYIDEPYKYDRFILETKDILVKSSVKILRERVNLVKEGAIWILKVKR
jgi:hypothetical protein